MKTKEGIIISVPSLCITFVFTSIRLFSNFLKLGVILSQRPLRVWSQFQVVMQVAADVTLGQLVFSAS